MVDLEQNDGSKEKPYYMNKDLLLIMDKENKKDDENKNKTDDKKWKVSIIQGSLNRDVHMLFTNVFLEMSR